MTLANHQGPDDGQEFSLPTELVPAPRMARVSRQNVAMENSIPAAAEEPQFDMKVYIHAVRRNWLLGTVFGILAGVPLAALAWTFVPKEFTATEYVRISQNQATLLYDQEKTGVHEYRSYKNTQKQILLQPQAFVKAFQHPDVANLDWVRENPGAIGWLQKEMKVSFPEDGEIMNVSLTLSEPKAAFTIVKVLIEIYMDEVVEKEISDRDKRIDILREILKATDTKVRGLRSQLIATAEAIGTGDHGTLNIAQQSALQQLGSLHSELSKIKFELMRMRAESAVRNGSQAATGGDPQSKDKTQDAVDEKKPATDVKSVPGAAVVQKPAEAGKSDNVKAPKELAAAERMDPRLEEAIENDPAASKLTNEIQRLKNSIKQTQQKYEPKQAAPYLEKYNVQLEEAQKKLAERTKRLERLMRAGAGTALESFDNTPLMIALLVKQQETLEEEIDKLETKANNLGRSSIDVEMKRKEIQDLDPVFSRVNQEIERSLIEKKSTPRIFKYDPNGIPQSESSKKRLPITAAAGLFGLLAPLALLVLLDSRRNPVNNVNTINDGIKISVLGTIPRIPARVMKRLNDTSHVAANRWRERITESVSAVTAMLLRKLEVEGHRVILVTSAVSGEGKSTLAEQLARSLADSGRRTLLIDFDLRRPQLHRRLSASLEPGVTDVLQHDLELHQAIQETSSPHLSLLTAGRPVGALLRFGANGTLSELFQKCREEFEIVLVDSSPLLPVVDGRIVGQYTDGALMTVIKDTSKVPQVMQARNTLCEYGIPILGCVVTGDDSSSYYSSYNYASEPEGGMARKIAATRSMSAM